MKILITGVRGQLGHDVQEELEKSGEYLIFACDKEEFDLTDSCQIEKYILENKPDAIIHCAAYTAVDKAEDEKELCRKINSEAPLTIAKSAEKLGAKMIYISTDYVFGGDGEAPYEIDSEKNPQNVYGKTKLQGENNVLSACARAFIVRTSWVYGINGNNFVKTMRRLGETKEEINVVDDQIGSPTYTRDLAHILCEMIKTEKYGVYHVTNEGFLSWADFAEKIMQMSDLKTKVNHISTAEYPAKAKRPLNSRLSKKSLTDNGFQLLPDQDDALKRFIAELENK